MELQQLTDKLKSGNLSSDEQKELFVEIDKEFEGLKEKEPQKYLEALKFLTEMMQELTALLKK